ncbi:MAG: hypothetical protein KDJ88_15930 [Bauldia sp.]|nr:hypothetical protein [Bauldia sp.]
MAALTYDDFFDALGDRESGGDYKAVNTLGYLGKYQFGELALIDVGYYTADQTSSNDWHAANWTGKSGVRSQADFLANPVAQDKAIHAYMDLQWSYLASVWEYVGQKIDGLKITASGLLAGAHLVGAGTVAEFLSSGGKNVPHDAYSTSVTEYLSLFAGYQTPFSVDHSADEDITGSRYADVIRGRGGDDVLTGLNGRDRLKGGGGDDTIDGGKGPDLMVGGPGSDTFVFRARLSGKPDVIKDFSPGNDTIALDHNVFGLLPKGPLDDGALHVGSAAKHAGGPLFYDTKTGELIYDGNGHAVVFAVLAKGLDLSADDFLVI